MKNKMKGTIKYEVTKFDWGNFLYVFIFISMVIYGLGYSGYIAVTEEVPRPVAENFFFTIATFSLVVSLIILIYAITKCFEKVEKEMKVEFEECNKK